MIILGIDPGLSDTGYGIIQKNNNKLALIGYGCITTDKSNKFQNRLGAISKELKKIIQKFKPDIAAVEELFFCKNVKTALLVNQARGAIIVTLDSAHTPMYEYTPLEVKQAITGYGKASKFQIQQMVKALLGLKVIPAPDHAADALAIAICCAHTIQFK